MHLMRPRCCLDTLVSIHLDQPRPVYCMRYCAQPCFFQLRLPKLGPLWLSVVIRQGTESMDRPT